MPRGNSVSGRPRPLSSDDLLSALYHRPLQRPRRNHARAPYGHLQWSSAAYSALSLVAVGWFLSAIQSDLRDVRKEVTGIRVEAALVTNTKLEELIAEFRRRTPR